MSVHTTHSPGAFPVSVSVTCRADRPVLALLRRFVGAVAADLGFDEEDLAKIEMAVDEACSNAVAHAYAEAAADRALDMAVFVERDCLTIQVRDYGPVFQGGGFAGEPTIKDYTAPGRECYRGLGVLIMKEFMDEVLFAPAESRGALVTLRKRRKTPLPHSA